MDKLIINNQEVNIISANSISNGLEIKTNALTLAEAEELFPTNVALSFEVANEQGEIYGKYANLKVYCIAKITESEEEIIEVKLGVLNETAEKLNALQDNVVYTELALIEIYETVLGGL